MGERYDADAGLQYLNARYYDPKLALFVQPDWFEVLQPGVGTNRYSYSFNDPVNLSDPGGNLVPLALAGIALCSGSGACEAIALGIGLVAGVLAVDRTYDGKIDGRLGAVGVGGVDVPGAVGALMEGLQDDGSFVTPGGNTIRNHGRKGDGGRYIEGKGHTPEQIDDIIANPTGGYETASGDTSTGGRSGAWVIESGGQWVVVNDEGRIIAVSDRENPERGKPQPKEQGEPDNSDKDDHENGN